MSRLKIVRGKLDSNDFFHFPFFASRFKIARGKLVCLASDLFFDRLSVWLAEVVLEALRNADDQTVCSMMKRSNLMRK